MTIPIQNLTSQIFAAFKTLDRSHGPTARAAIQRDKLNHAKAATMCPGSTKMAGTSQTSELCSWKVTELWREIPAAIF